MLRHLQTFRILANGGKPSLQNGYGRIGGTKVFALAKLKRRTRRDPMGMTVRDVIFDIGGGNPKRRQAIQSPVQMEGGSGGCIHHLLVDTVIDYNPSPKQVPSWVPAVFVMDETTCMVDMARFFLDFTCKESWENASTAELVQREC